MRSNYKKLGPYIRQVDVRNKEGTEENLLGVSTQKVFIESIANTVGTDFRKYKVVKRNQFTYVPDTSRRGDKIGLAMLEHLNEGIVSQAYTVFEIIDHEALDPEYLMMWFRRPEFDRYARYKSHGSVREIFGWDEMCDVDLPMPSIEKQREIVREYNTIVNRIQLNEQLNQKLEETAQAIYKHWFVDFEFPISAEYAASIGKPELEGKPYKSSGGEMVAGDKTFNEVPKSWSIEGLKDLTSKIGSGATPKGGKAAYCSQGTSLIRSLNIFDYNFSYKDLAFINDSQASKLSNVEVKTNDVLINITGVSVARCYKAPANVLPARVNQHVAIIRPSEGLKISNYLVCALCSTDYKSRLLGISEGGSTRQALTKTDIEDCKVLLPDNTTASHFESFASPIFSKKEQLSEENLLLLKAKELLLSAIAAEKNMIMRAA
jgi:type I restriction enzyme S subunit